MVRRVASLLIGVIVFGVYGLSFAQKPNKKTAKQAQVEERIKEYRHYIIQTELGLDDATAAKLFAVMDPYTEKIQTLRLEEREIHQNLKAELLKEKPDEKKLEGLLDDLTAKDLEIQKTRNEAFQATKGILTSKQRVELLELIPDVDRRIRELIKEAKKKPK